MGVAGIQSLTLALTTSMMLATCAILGGISITTGTESTNDARATGDRGIEQCMHSGAENVRSVSSRLLRAVLNDFRTNVRNRIIAPSEFADQVARFLEMMHPDIPGNPDFFENTMRPFMFSKHLHLYGKLRDTASVLVLAGDSPNSDELRKQYNDSWGGLMSFFVAGIREDKSPAHGVIETRKFYPDGPISVNPLARVGNADSTGHLIGGKCNFLDPTNYGDCPLRIEAAFDPLRVELLKRCYDNAFSNDLTSYLEDPGYTIYSPIIGAGPQVSVQTCRSMSHPLQVNRTARQQGRIGHIDSSQNVAGISTYMKQISLPINSLLYAIERHPWSGVVGTVAGCNVGEPFSTVRQFDAQGNEIWRVATPFQAVNHTLNGELDGPLSPIARHSRFMLHEMANKTNASNHYEYSTNVPEGTILEWTDTNTSILYWSSFAKVEFSNIKWYIAFLVPRSSVMAVIDEAVEAIRINIEKDKKKADDERANKHIIMYSVTTGCVVILLSLAVVLTNVIISPLRVLIKEMAAVAVMQTESVDLQSDLSNLSEVSEMQTSFRAMVKNLIEYRNYMPQSVLYSSDSSGELDSKTDGESTLRMSNRSWHSNSSNHKHLSQYQHATELGIRNRVVSVVMFNSIGWHSTYHQGGDAEAEAVLERHRLLVESLTQAVDSHRGVCDSFSGDRLMAYFNAMRNNGEHKSCAVKAAVSARKKCQLNISFAVTSGTAKVGNMGIVGMRKFTILSTIVPFAAALERFNSAKGYKGLIDDRCYEYSHLVVNSRAASLVTYAKRYNAPSLIYEAISIRELQEQEWMYQINSDGIYTKWNAAVVSITSDKFEEAEDFFDESNDDFGGDSVFCSWRTTCVERKVTPVILI